MEKWVKCKKVYYYEGRPYYSVGLMYTVHKSSLDGDTFFNIVGGELALTDIELEVYFDNVYELRKKKITKLLSETVQEIQM